LKHLRETFTDQEFAELAEIKKRSKMNWHNLLIESIKCLDAEWSWKWKEDLEEAKIK